MLKAHLKCVSLLAVAAGSAYAASPLATQAWVRKMLAEQGTVAAQTVTVQQTPVVLSQAVAGSLPFSEGAETADVTVASTTNVLKLIVRTSSVTTLPTGTELTWSRTTGAFTGTSLPPVVFAAMQTQTVTTNVMGNVVTVTNRVESYSCSTGGTNYHSQVHAGRTYLVSDLGIGGPKCEFYLLRTRAVTPAPMLTTTAGPRFAAAQPTYDEPQQGICGGIAIGTISWTKNGTTYTFTGNYTGGFTVAGYTSIYDYCGALLELFVGGNYDCLSAGWTALEDAVGDPRNWGLFAEGANTMSGTDGKNITYSAFKGSPFWQGVVSEATAWLMAEYYRLIQLYFDNAAKHNCPYKDGAWTPDDDCRCQFSWRGQDGREQECAMHAASQHAWQTVVASGSAVALASVGCTVCARCHQADPDRGASHLAVPDTDEYDWCGCYCRYYFQKKKRADESDTDAISSADTVKTDTRYDSYVIGGHTFYRPISYIAATNREALAVADNPWTQVRRTVTDPWGVACAVVSSVASVADDDSGDESYHCDPVTDPMECTCTCGLHHTFKPSPCPKVCRGCGSHANEYNNYLSTNSAPAKYHCDIASGNWDVVNYVDEEGEPQTWDPTVDGPFASWHATVTNGLAGCGCACGKRRTSTSGAPGVWGDHANFHCYASKPTSTISDPFTRWFVENRLGLARVPYCSCNNCDWEKEHESCVGGYGRNRCGLPTCRDICMFHGVRHGIVGDDNVWKCHTGIMRIDSVMSEDWFLGDLQVAADDVYAAFLAYDGGFEFDHCGCLCGAVSQATSAAHGIDRWPGETGELWHAIDFAATNCICVCGHYHACISDEYLDKVDPYRRLCDLRSRTACPGICAFCGFYDQSGPTGTIRRAEIQAHTPASSACACQCHLETAWPKRFKNSAGVLVRGFAASIDGFEYVNNTLDSSSGYNDKTEEFKRWHHTFDSDHHFCIGCNYQYKLCHLADWGSACSNVCKVKVGNLERDICGHADPYYVASKIGGIEYNLGVHVHAKDGEYCGCDCGWDLNLGNSAVAHFGPTNDCYCFATLASYKYHENSEVHVSTESNPNGEVFLEHRGPIVNLNRTNLTEECVYCGEVTRRTVISNQCQMCSDIIVQTIGDGHSCQVRCCTCCDGGCTCQYCLYRIGTECTCNKSPDGGRTLKYTDTNVVEGQYADSAVGNSTLETVDGSDPVVTVARRGFAGAWSNCVKLVSANFSATTEVGEDAFSGAFAGDTSLKFVRFPNLEYGAPGAFRGAFRACSNLELLDFSRMLITPDAANIFDGNDGCTSTNLVIKLSGITPNLVYTKTLPEMFTAIKEIHFYCSDGTGKVDPQSPASFFVTAGSATKIYVPASSRADWIADSEWTPYAANILAEPSQQGADR